MLWIAPAAALAVLWLWFLGRGRAPGAVKRLAFRATLAALVVGLLLLAGRRGLFERSSLGFQLAVGAAMLAVVVGYLYTTRFCPQCGYMVRNLKASACPRCGALLTRHGMTAALHRRGDDLLRAEVLPGRAARTRMRR